MSSGGRIGWGIIICSAIGVYGLGVWGYLMHGYSPGNALYASLQLFVMEANYGAQDSIAIPLVVARIMAPLVMAATAIRTATLLLRREIASWKLSKLAGHAIICGLQREGFELMKQLRADGVPVVVIDEDENNTFISSCELFGCHVVFGDATSPSVLENARAHFASQLYLISGDDGANLSALMKLVELMQDMHHKDAAAKLKVWLQIDAIDICSFLRNEDSIGHLCKYIEVEVISMYEVVARNLIVEHLYPIVPAEKGDSRDVCLTIAGFGRMGKTIVTRAVRLLVLPDPDSRLIINVIDRNAVDEVENLKSEHPHLTEFCEIIPHEGDIGHAAFRHAIIDLLDVSNALSVVVFCIDDAYLNMSSALYIAEGHWKVSGGKKIPVLVRLSEGSGWQNLLEAHQYGEEWTHQIKGFGTVSEVCDHKIITQSKLDRLARAMHEYYIDQCADPENPSCRPWNTLPWIFRDSNRLAADHMLIKFRYLGLQPAEEKVAARSPWPPEEPLFTDLARLEHRRWCVERMMSGWRFGDASKKEQRISNDLVGWDQLADQEKEKDYEQIRAYPHILDRAGMCIAKKAGT